MMCLFSNVPPECPSDFPDGTSGAELKNRFAGVMELADVMDSKSIVGNNVPVRVRPAAPQYLPYIDKSLTAYTIYGRCFFIAWYQGFLRIAVR